MKCLKRTTYTWPYRVAGDIVSWLLLAQVTLQDKHNWRIEEENDDGIDKKKWEIN